MWLARAKGPSALGFVEQLSGGLSTPAGLLPADFGFCPFPAPSPPTRSSSTQLSECELLRPDSGFPPVWRAGGPVLTL